MRAHRYLPLLLAVGAGLLLGTAFLDLLPEAVLMARSTGQPPKIVLATAWAAFLGFLVIESISDAIGRLQHRRTAIRKTLGRISGGPPNPSQLPRWHGDWRGLFRLQGGWAHSSCGIVAHDIGDGMNTVLLCTAGEKPGLWDSAFLAADALAPFSEAC